MAEHPDFRIGETLDEKERHGIECQRKMTNSRIPEKEKQQKLAAGRKGEEKCQNISQDIQVYFVYWEARLHTVFHRRCTMKRVIS